MSAERGTTSAGSGPGPGTSRPGVPGTDAGDVLERRIGRLLTVGTVASMASIAVGVVGMAVTGRSPLDVSPPLDAARLPADLLALRPVAFLWLGLIGAIATPCARVAAALVGYTRTGERAMAIVAGLVLLVVALGVLAGTLES